MSYVSAKAASKYFGVTTKTLRTWEKNGKVEAIKTQGDHRRYKIVLPTTGKRKIIYARVSSAKQRGDLNRQVSYLAAKYPGYEVIRDIGSGLNGKRKGLRKILEQLFSGNIQDVVVSSSDRLSRFGMSSLLIWIFQYFGATLTIDSTTKQSPKERFAEDLMEIVSVFAARYNGNRKYGN